MIASPTTTDFHSTTTQTTHFARGTIRVNASRHRQDKSKESIFSSSAHASTEMRVKHGLVHQFLDGLTNVKVKIIAVKTVLMAGTMHLAITVSGTLAETTATIMVVETRILAKQQIRLAALAVSPRKKQ